MFGVWFVLGDIILVSILCNLMIYVLVVVLGLIVLGWSLLLLLCDVICLLGGIIVLLMLVMFGLLLVGLCLYEIWWLLLLFLVWVWGGFVVGYGIVVGLGMEVVVVGIFVI